MNERVVHAYSVMVRGDGGEIVSIANGNYYKAFRIRGIQSKRYINLRVGLVGIIFLFTFEV
jgi:hypothetical protein